MFLTYFVIYFAVILGITAFTETSSLPEFDRGIRYAREPTFPVDLYRCNITAFRDRVFRYAREPTLPFYVYQNTTYTPVLLVPKVTALAVIPSAPEIVPLWCNPFFVSFFVMATMVTVAVLAVNWDNGDQKDDGKEDENKMSSDMNICLTEQQCAPTTTLNPLASCAENHLCGKNIPDFDKRTEAMEKEVQELVPLHARCESRSPPVMGNKSIAPVGIHHNNHEASRMTLHETVSDIESRTTARQLLCEEAVRVKVSYDDAPIAWRSIPTIVEALFPGTVAPHRCRTASAASITSDLTILAVPQSASSRILLDFIKASPTTAELQEALQPRIKENGPITVGPRPAISANSRTATVASFKNVETELQQKDASSDNDNKSISSRRDIGGRVSRTTSRPLSAPMPRRSRSISNLERDLPTPRKATRSVSLPDLTMDKSRALFSVGEQAKSSMLRLDTPKPQSGQVPAIITESTRNRNSNKELGKAGTTKSGQSASAISHPTKSKKDRTRYKTTMSTKSSTNLHSSTYITKTIDQFASKSGASFTVPLNNKDRSSKSIFSKSSFSANPTSSNNARPTTTDSNKNRSVARRNLTKGDSGPSAYTLKVIRENLRTSSLPVTPPEKIPKKPLPPKPTKAQKRKARRAKLEMYLSMSLNTQGAHGEESSKTPGVTKRLIKITEDASPTTGTSGVHEKATVIDRAARPVSTPNDPNEVKGVCASESPSLLSAYDIQESINSLSIHPKETRTQKRRRRREKAKLYASLNSLSNDTTPVNDSKADNTQVNVTEIDEAIANAALNTCKDVLKADEDCVSEKTSDTSECPTD
ncbi:uncharacterized protein LOC125558983 [Nematostella vectensis]|uniref:uncharacterized protein LOC125558983 n=1 Tax=Nematostella vectensis TaxID=45351 RepID=UPI00207726DE|nr:uncharacterized protein LOC125558983 [Nematostella vectensis]